MKNKILFYSLALFSAMSLYSCDEDFKDWADPQTNEQLESEARFAGVIEAGNNKDIICDNFDLSKDSADIFTVASMNAPEGSVAMIKSFVINDNYSVPFTDVNGTAKVAVAQLDSVVELAYKSRANEKRTITIKPTVSAMIPNGDGILLDCNSLDITLTPPTPPEVDPDGYSLVGDLKGWNKAGAMAFTKISDNIFSIEIETTKDGMYFKFFRNKGLEGDDLDWSYAIGSPKDGDTSGDNFIVWNDPQAIKIDKEGKYKITLDMTNYRFTVKDNSAPSELYMTGSKYGWGETWNPFTMVNGMLGEFWGIFYFEENEQIKFAPQAGWGKDFGYVSNISQESIDLAGLTDEGGNIKVGKAGWYVVYVNAKESDRTIEFQTPNIYMIGNCTGDWTADKEDFKFSIPTTADGVFTSPKTIADGDVRMYIKIKEVSDWWRAEFKVIKGNIVCRGNGGEISDESQATAGQIVTLNFTNGTGEIK